MKRIIAVAAIFVMLAPLPSCAQKTHFKFEKIKNAYFREKTQFFAFNDLIYVIDRDKLVCMNPDNGQMVESVDLPGYPTDVKGDQPWKSNLIMTFRSGDFFLFKEYGFNGEKPYITEKKSFNTKGSKILFAVNDDIILYDDQTRMLSGYKSGKIAGSLTLDNPCLVGLSSGYVIPRNQMSVIEIYDGKYLSFAGFDKDCKIVYPLKEMPRIDIPSKNLAESRIIMNGVDVPCIYDGESFNFIVSEDGFKTYKINKVNFPKLLDASCDLLNIYALNNRGLFIIDYEEPTMISDGMFKMIDFARMNDGNEKQLSRMIYLLGMQVGNTYRVECTVTRGPINLIRGNDNLVQTYTFDNLPEGTFCVRLAKIKGMIYVYAFTSEGLFRSEVIAEYKTENP